MSLTVGLAVIGGLILAAVIAHSAWMQRRNAPKRAEPELDARASATQSAVDPGFADGDLVFSVGGVTEEVDTSQIRPHAPNSERRITLDALIDSIVPISLEHEVSGDLALAALPPTRRVGTKPFFVEGRGAGGAWESLHPGVRYQALQAGVQLANRAGALNEIEFSEFVQKVTAYADAVGGDPEFADMHGEVVRAKELDQFASGHDAQLSFTIRARGAAWSTGYLQQHAARQGFVAGAIPGRMVLSASEPGLPPILVLSYDSQVAMADDPEQSAVRRVDLALDAPLVDRTERPYARLREIAIALAAGMEGVICDAAGQLISRDAMDAIGADLEHLYDTLEARDLAAGSAQARRLFS